MVRPTKEFEDLFTEMRVLLDSSENELSIFEKKSIKEQLASQHDFFAKANKFAQELKNIRLKFMESSLHEAFCYWSACIEPRIYGDLGDFLVREMFIVLYDKLNHPLTIKSVENLDHTKIIDQIRCTRTFSILLRENLILAYLSFFNWLSELTDHFLPALVDPDASRWNRRVIPFPIFIRFLSQLKDNEQVVAKLLYYGGSRTLEEVLSLDLKDVDFKSGFIYFGTQFISYPQHIFNDIKVITNTRSSGKIFKGRQNAPLNPATIFRNFKEAAIKVGLGQIFSPKLLTTND